MEMPQKSVFLGMIDAELAARRTHVERLRGGTVVFTNGVFDLLHRGHLEYLKQARAIGNVLIVGLNSDDSTRRIKGPNRPLIGQEDRAFALLSLSFVDHVVIFDEDTPEELIRRIRPHVLVKGGDYKPEDIVGYQDVVASGGRVQVIPFLEGYSTSGLIETIVERYSSSCLKT